tara:strand:- start:736 stop:2361 length:1626 start_codon:yes stop_codon:yes gene_type:complete
MGVGSTFAAYYDSAITYMHKGAQYITVNDCYFTGAGDDNLTTHFSSDISITNCISESPRGGYSTVDSGGPNTNCFEIDDGSRNVQMYNCRAYKGNQGVEIKAHGYAPAPYNVIVDGMEIINCVGGVECHHSGWRTQTRASDTAWRANGGIDNATVPTDLQATYAAGKLTSLSDNGYSATGNNVTLSNIQIIAPCDQTFKKMGNNGADKDADTSRPQRAFELGSYDGVVVNNLTISDGSKDRAYTIDGYQPNSNLVTNNSATGSNGYVMHLHNSVRNWTMNNVSINGFFSNSAGTKKGADSGIRIVSNIDEGFVINNLTIADGPAQAIYQTGSNGRFVGTINNYTIYQTNTLTDNTTWNALSSDKQYAFRLNQDGIKVGKGNIIGYGSQASTVSDIWHKEKTDNQTISGTPEWTNISGLSQTVTALSPASKFLITATVNASMAGDGYDGLVRLMRGTTVIGSTSTEGSATANNTGFGQVSGQNSKFEANSLSITYLDTPGVGSHTYHIEGRNTDSSVNMVINRRGLNNDFFLVSHMTIQQIS